MKDNKFDTEKKQKEKEDIQKSNSIRKDLMQTFEKTQEEKDQSDKAHAEMVHKMNLER